MISNIITVSNQVLVLLLLVCVGYLCGKRKLLSEEMTNGLATLCLYVVAPCLMITSFQREFHPYLLHNFLVTLFAALLIQGACILATRVTIRDREPKRRNVLRATVIFSNCGMMSLALQSSLYGADGVFYGAAYIAAFNLLFWTYGVLLLGRREDISLRKVLLNPGIVGTVAGLVFFFASYTLPAPVKDACDHIANLNTPLSMLVIGQRISAGNLKTLFSDRGAAWSVAQRLGIVPLLVILVFSFLRVDSTAAMVCVIASCAPAAAANTMLAIELKQDSALSVKTVSMGTLLSMLTMPVVIILAEVVL